MIVDVIKSFLGHDKKTINAHKANILKKGPTPRDIAVLKSLLGLDHQAIIKVRHADTLTEGQGPVSFQHGLKAHVHSNPLIFDRAESPFHHYCGSQKSSG